MTQQQLTRKAQSGLELMQAGFQIFEDMALKKVRSNIDRIFDKSLTDLIRGIRNNKENEARYIAACMEEIKMELRQDSIYVKANAIEKLAYLQMLGYNISWASFNIIEVMASTKYTEKRIGYLAAAQSFHDETDVLMLTTNLIRKDVNSPNMYDSGVALNGLSCFITPDLARDLASDILNLLSSSRPYTRKRAVLLLFKVFLKYPDALRPTFPKLKEKLEDSDPGVQSAAVNVICELARKNPKNYLTLAPVFFKLMTTSCNNWMLIKIIKLFGALVPLEPRLGKKLLEPLTNLINSTSAMSLLYECINTVIAVLISISAGGDHTASIQLCVQKLGVLIEDSDQNLKYLGLLAMGKILKTHPKAVQAHKDIVLRCLDDKDESIRLRSLDLLYGMVSKKNIAEIVKKLMEHVEAAEGSHYRDELLSRVLGICSYNNYHYVSNFEWYISVLVELTKVEGTKHGQKIAEQIQDVTVRVESIRHFSVSQMALLIENAHLLLAGSTQQRNNLCEVLLAAAWICGEYSQHVQNVQGVLDAMLRAKTSIIPGHILSVYVQNIGKLYANLLNTAEEEDDWDAIETLDNLMLSKLPQFELAEHLEAQERACTLMSILKIVEQQHQQKIKMGEEISHLYEGELNPVAQKAQKKVPVPEGLDLNEWLGDPWESTPEESSDSEFESTFGQPAPRYNINSPENEEDDDEEEEEVVVPVKHKRKSKKEEAEELRKKREQEIENNPYYVKGKATVPKRPTKFVTSVEKSASKDKMNEIQSPLEIPGVVGLNKYMEQQDSTLSWKKAKKTKKPLKKSKKTRRRKTSTSSEEESIVVHKVNREDGEMPEGAKSTDDEDNMKGVSDEFKALDIDLDAPLRPDEIVRAPQAYTRIYPQKQGPLVPRPPTIESRPQEIGYNNQYLVPSVKEPKKKTKKVKSDREENGEKKKTKKKKKPLVKNGSEQNILNVDDWLEEQTTTATVEKARDTLVAEKKTKKKAKKNRDAYEETSGICTPSVPTASTAFEDLAEDFTLIAANKEISADVSYRASLDAMEFGRVAVALRLKNVTSQRVKNVKLTTVDTLNAKVVKRDEDTLTLLDALGSGESNVANFDVQVKNTTMANTIRGTLTYFLESEEGSSEEKLDLRLSLSASTFLVGTPISNQEYSRILSSEDVDYASSRSVVTTATLKQALTHVVKKGHFRVIEETARAASLFAKTISSEPVCLLVKKTNDGIQIDGKAGDERLIIAVVQDIAEICART